LHFETKKRIVMKKVNIILTLATATIAIVGSFAFKLGANKMFGQGTLFSQPLTGPCHAINCQRTIGTNMCVGFAPPYYTTANCTGTEYDAAVTVGL